MNEGSFQEHADRLSGRHTPTERAENRGGAETAQPDTLNTGTAVRAAILDVVRSAEFGDAVAEVIRAQVGMIPTAKEIAVALAAEYEGRAVPTEADRTEGHPTNPEDGLS